VAASLLLKDNTAPSWSPRLQCAIFKIGVNDYGRLRHPRMGTQQEKLAKEHRDQSGADTQIPHQR
jgi:hypothetical protein